MSGGVLYRHALGVLARLDVPDVARRDLLAVMEASQPGPLPLLYEAGVAAGLDRAALLDRGAALFFGFCAGNLADDLCDGDAGYVPARIGPVAQFLLQNLCWARLAACVPADAIAAAAGELALGAGPQHVEVRTEAWDEATYRLVAEGIAGRQWAAWLGLLWAGTPLADRAGELGRRLGVVAQVALDRGTGDRRFHSMAGHEQARVLGWAREELAAVAACGIAGVASTVAWAAPMLADGPAERAEDVSARPPTRAP